MIVAADANIELAAKGALASKTKNAGQIVAQPLLRAPLAHRGFRRRRPQAVKR